MMIMMMIFPEFRLLRFLDTVLAFLRQSDEFLPTMNPIFWAAMRCFTKWTASRSLRFVDNPQSGRRLKIS